MMNAPVTTPTKGTIIAEAVLVSGSSLPFTTISFALLFTTLLLPPFSLSVPGAIAGAVGETVEVGNVVGKTVDVGTIVGSTVEVGAVVGKTVTVAGAVGATVGVTVADGKTVGLSVGSVEIGDSVGDAGAEDKFGAFVGLLLGFVGTI